MYFIAEIGVNHNGQLSLAKEMIDSAKKSGANAVKFQAFSAKKLALENTPKTSYQIKSEGKGDSHFEMLKRLELSNNDLIQIYNYTKKKKIDFICTPYDVTSAKFLNKIGCKVYKTASADLVDVFLHKYLAKVAKKVIISVGMSTLGEIESCLDIYKNSKAEILLLHCVTNYPCSDESLNMRVITTLKRTFDLDVGFSDHSIGSTAGILSVAFGSKVIEKHFTLDKTMFGPDHKASSEPKEFAHLVAEVNRAEKQLGNYKKQVREEEKNMLSISRKSIYVDAPIKKGQKITKKNIKLCRPGGGLTPFLVEEIIGKKATKTLKKNKLLKHGDFE